jgi:aminoglycoside phosphotransferase (APT) family kinase protein
MGNVLWDRNEISGVIDWETAAYGDPAIDVAYCRMDMSMVGLFEAADCFLKSYEAATGRHVENLELWELVAAAGLLPDPARWLSYWQEIGDTWSTPESMRRNLRRFVADALRRAML